MARIMGLFDDDLFPEFRGRACFCRTHLFQHFMIRLRMLIQNVQHVEWADTARELLEPGCHDLCRNHPQQERHGLRRKLNEPSALHVIYKICKVLNTRRLPSRLASHHGHTCTPLDFIPPNLDIA